MAHWAPAIYPLQLGTQCADDIMLANLISSSLSWCRRTRGYEYGRAKLSMRPLCAWPETSFQSTIIGWTLPVPDGCQ